MIDFLLNSTRDDIIIDQSNRSKQLKIQFDVSESSKKLKIQFFVETIARPKQTTFPLKINFTIQNENNPYAKKNVYAASVCQDNEDYIIQQIMIKLKTEIGEILQRPLIGSRLVEYRHKDKFNKANLLAIQEIVEGIVNDDNYIIKVKPNVDEKQIMSWHNIHIEIKHKETNRVLKGFII